MSVRISEENYKMAKSLYLEVSDDFYEIENNDEKDDSYKINQILEKIKKLNRHISRINLDDLEDAYNSNTLDIISDNVGTSDEGSYFIERALVSMKLFDNLHPVLNQYMKKIDYGIIGKDLDDAVLKFGRFLTHEDNYEQYKSVANSILKGSMSEKLFAKYFKTISYRMPKRKRNVKQKNQRHPLPPEMWPDKERKDWYDMIKKRREEASEENEKDKYNVINFEGFVPLKKYKKIFESLAYYCGNCGERAEHEEIEDNPNLICGNCGGTEWIQEY